MNFNTPPHQRHPSDIPGKIGQSYEEIGRQYFSVNAMETLIAQRAPTHDYAAEYFNCAPGPTASITRAGQHLFTGTRAQCLDVLRRWEHVGETGLEVTP